MLPSGALSSRLREQVTNQHQKKTKGKIERWITEKQGAPPFIIQYSKTPELATFLYSTNKVW